MVYVFLANGFEECEALVPVDILRRGGIKVSTVGTRLTTLLSGHEARKLSGQHRRQVSGRSFLELSTVDLSHGTCHIDFLLRTITHYDHVIEVLVIVLKDQFQRAVFLRLEKKGVVTHTTNLDFHSAAWHFHTPFSVQIRDGSV